MEQKEKKIKKVLNISLSLKDNERLKKLGEQAQEEFGTFKAGTYALGLIIKDLNRRGIK